MSAHAGLMVPHTIADAMGWAAVLKTSVRSMLDLHTVIVQGVPKAAVTFLGKTFADVMPELRGGWMVSAGLAMSVVLGFAVLMVLLPPIRHGLPILLACVVLELLSMAWDEG